MIISGNLSRISISEYQLKIKKNHYPLITYGNQNIEILENLISFRKVNQVAPINIEIFKSFAILDLMNQELRPCSYCNIPYSFNLIEADYYCIFCYIILINKPVTFYTQFDNENNLISINMHPQNIPIKSPILATIFKSIDLETLQQKLDKYKDTQSSKNRSLDEFL